MKTIYFDCSMGAAGDMLSAALIELFPDPAGIAAKLNAVGIPDVCYSIEPSVKCGITGTHMTVTVNGAEEDEHMHDHHHDNYHDHDHHHDDDHHHDHDHDHHHDHVHHGMADIEPVVRDHLDLPKEVKDDVLKVFGLIAEAESHVHGVPVNEIHFHEVGTMDAVADVTAVCYMMHELKPDRVVASPIHVGSGQVKCAHGILPVPAPATAYILKGIPFYGGAIKSELCTPTGAALLKHFVTSFGDMPVMSVSAIGYGMGKKDFEAANCVRAMLGESGDSADKVLELSCNVDDMTAEAVSYACEKLFEGGARDVYTVPIGMKKGRPGTLIRVLISPDDREKMVGLIFKHTSTLGIREVELNRHILKRDIENVETPFGTVRRKVSTGYGVTRAKYEYEDLARIADEQGLSITELISKLP